jgi:hypothetical protein
LKLGDLGEYSVELRKTKDGKMMIYRRRFDWGRNGKLLIPAGAYANVKKAFDWIQEQDGHTISLKPEEAAASAAR